ncbi:hypothetical protein I2492_15540 [Budviciaceae bacterium CWB-B4]|uniref:Uncharacterized protein n=1 Tax=Limnobaculum xujianqingii TaxID=2738837 RepID=A0A9D7AK84_9GAMM|nr:hypothetical protein [Limnobaculum xujianqingii]MBK5074600.1 hypothetical protein [Limnobaculum xujianqingii]MBK5177734.1 hypothetical protein [Limnobaculum xujianqingii]
MNPTMPERVRNYLVDGGLLVDCVVQMLRWVDTAKKTDTFVVFRSNGGSNIRNDLGAEYYILVDVVGAINDDRKTDQLVNSIIDFVQQNPLSNCLGYIENMGGTPAPIDTTEGRLVYRLLFRVVFGE